MVGDVYGHTYRGIRVYLPVHLVAIASIDSYSNSCGVDCTDILSVLKACWVWQHDLGDAFLSIGALRAPDYPAT